MYLASQQTETDGDALPSDVPMRISLVSPGSRHNSVASKWLSDTWPTSCAGTAIR